MELEPYVEDIHRHVAQAAEAAGDEARELAERLIGPLDAAIRLAIQHALADAADEITVELAPGSVELRVRGRELAFVVTAPPETADAPADEPPPAVDAPPGPDAEMARINLRLPEQLKTRVEHAAAAQGLSVNAWLVRAAGTAVERADAAPRAERHTNRGTQRYRGWAR